MGSAESSEKEHLAREVMAKEQTLSLKDSMPAVLPKQNKKACWLSPAGFLFVTRQRPTFPLPRGSSNIGLGGLNFRVRYGNGWGPSGMATGNIHH
jgi:hypothetical protein